MARIMSERFLFLPISLLVPSLEVKCELVDQNGKSKQKNQLERKTRRLSAILNESEASVSASVVLIPSRSEDSFDSDCNSIPLLSLE